MNYYGTKNHKNRINELKQLISSKIDFSNIANTRKLDNSYYIKYYEYQDDKNELTICKLYNGVKQIYEWIIDYDSLRLNVCKIINHSNGNNYFIFVEDLYGYSVLDLTTLKCIHYIPEESRKENYNECEETFIWCECYYNSCNNLLAIEGCYWACPYTIIVVNFTNPMKIIESKLWLDIYHEIKGLQLGINDIEFVKWENNQLICKSDELNNKSFNINKALDVVFN